MYTAESSIKTAGEGSREIWIAELTRRGADLPQQIVDAYIKWGKLIGYNHDLALAQGIEESAGFTDWKWTQRRNPAGLGSTSRAVPGDFFPSVDAGITAQYAHQAAYAETAESCPIEKMGVDMTDLFNDSRHGLVGHRGTPQISAWNGAWAVPGDSYAQNIAAIANATLDGTAAGELGPTPAAPTLPGTAPTVVDLRGQLYRNPSGGPNYQNDAKVGTVSHYNGDPPDADARTQYMNDAVYHAHKDWGNDNLGDGIMYHYGIQSGDGGSDPDGTIYQLRDEADVLWHCGSWVPGGNDTGIAININIGGDQHASPAALASAKWLIDNLRTRRGIDQQMVKGHQELSPTACPGSEMEDLVLPYRAGQMAATLPPALVDGMLDENGFVIGGGFKGIVDRLEAVSHEFRMMILGYCLSNEGDGYLLSPELRDDGSQTGRYHVKKVVVQKFERLPLIHEADEPNPEWQDVVPLLGRGFIAGFADDLEIDAILKNERAQVPA